MNGQILGLAGGGLDHSDDWAHSREAARAGKQGEQRTARLLDAMVHGGGRATVMHDVDVPEWKSGNIDHIVISRTTVLLIDSKSWLGGFYWSLNGRTARRGWERVDYTVKPVMRNAAAATHRHLMRAGLPVRMPTPVIAVWPSSRDASVSMWALRCDGVRYLPATGLSKIVRPLMRKPADPKIVEALYPLLVTKQ